MAIALFALLFLLAGGGDQAAATADCPNEARRLEQDATNLPDCRAFELVTPDALFGGRRIARAASGGEALTYYTSHPAPNATSNSFFYLANRGTEGWKYQSIGPQNASAALFGPLCEQNVFFSPDLSRYVLEAGWYEAGEPARCKRTEEPIVAEEPVPYRNLFLYEVGGAPRWINLTPEEVLPGNATFQDGADDLSRIVFAEEAKLTPDAPPGYNFYLWSEDALRLLTVLPDGSPATGELVEATSHMSGGTFIDSSGFAPLTGALSADGRRAFFYSGDGLYLRENVDRPQSPTMGGQCLDPTLACTVQVDASQGPGADGGGVFWRATPDASTAFFTADRKLTTDSTAESGKADLYRYDAATEQLTDLTVQAGEPADVRGVIGMAEDGSYLYFVANGALAPGATPGDCDGSLFTSGQCSLYLLNGGSITFIARLSGSEPWVWQETFEDTDLRHKGTALSANLSPNGKHLIFLSSQSLTDYDNYNPKQEAFDPELFLYDADPAGGAGELSCLSCPPGPSQDPFPAIASAGNYGPLSSGNASWMRHAVLDDGTIFFTTANPLLPKDSDTEADVYQYSGGTPHLLSPGGAGPAEFLDASPDGSDVFFSTATSLVGQDLDKGGLSLYDARAGGGFAEPTPAPSGCEADACRTTIEPPVAAPQPATGWVRPKPRKACHRRRAHQRRHGRDRHRAPPRRCGKGRRR